MSSSTDLIRYDLLAQEALRGVVRRVLTDAARDGLPGEHHFYVSFKTAHPGVRISSRLREKYPDEITIVLQHQFWDLTISDSAFEVGLSFGGAPERLLVPFEAVSGFFDPSVQFGLKFEVVTEEPIPAAGAGQDGKRAAPKGAASEPKEATPTKATKGGTKAPAPKLSVAPRSDKDAPEADNADQSGTVAGGTAASGTPPAPAGEKIVSLDTFRKKK
jgi:hypothetical protein